MNINIKIDKKILIFFNNKYFTLNKFYKIYAS